MAHAERLERNRRERKHAAVRAVLPLALSQVIAYAEKSAQSLNRLSELCGRGGTLPFGTALAMIVEPLPVETLKTLTDFIEYTDGELGVLESTVAWIQIHDARVRSIVESNNDPSLTRIVVQLELENSIIDAASIYAGAAAFFNYARRREANWPRSLSWDGVFGALRNMRFWDEQTSLYANVERRERGSSGPFDTLAR